MSMLKQATSVTKIANGCDESNQEHGNTGQYLVHLGGKKLSMDLMNLIRKQVELRMTALEHGRSYTLKQICGEEFWSQLEKRQCIEAGQCMVYMTEQKNFPLTIAKCAHEYPKRYTLN